MSGITIHDLVNEPMRTQEDYDKWEVVRSTEIVPRKIVEMIIEKCNEENKYVNNSYYSRKINNIREYAELLLKQFEGGEDE